jgi:hypothetical protein
MLEGGWGNNFELKGLLNYIGISICENPAMPFTVAKAQRQTMSTCVHECCVGA